MSSVNVDDRVEGLQTVLYKKVSSAYGHASGVAKNVSRSTQKLYGTLETGTREVFSHREDWLPGPVERWVVSRIASADEQREFAGILDRMEGRASRSAPDEKTQDEKLPQLTEPYLAAGSTQTISRLRQWMIGTGFKIRLFPAYYARKTDKAVAWFNALPTLQDKVEVAFLSAVAAFLFIEFVWMKVLFWCSMVLQLALAVALTALAGVAFYMYELHMNHGEKYFPERFMTHIQGMGYTSAYAAGFFETQLLNYFSEDSRESVKKEVDRLERTTGSDDGRPVEPAPSLTYAQTAASYVLYPLRKLDKASQAFCKMNTFDQCIAAVFAAMVVYAFIQYVQATAVGLLASVIRFAMLAAIGFLALVAVGVGHSAYEYLTTPAILLEERLPNAVQMVPLNSGDLTPKNRTHC